jgi:hypothetical protein
MEPQGGTRKFRLDAGRNQHVAIQKLEEGREPEVVERTHRRRVADDDHFFVPTRRSVSTSLSSSSTVGE